MSTIDPSGQQVVSRTWSRQRFDVWNEVPLVPQLTGMSCWAAAAAMVVGWRDRIAVRPADVAAGTGSWGAYQDGLLPEDLGQLAAAWGLCVEPPIEWTVAALRDRLERHGPLWMGEASPGLHSIVVTGSYGDGTADGSFVRINDPWPIGRGERYVLVFAELMRNFRAATDVVGVHAQVLHAGGRGRGTSRRALREEHHSITSIRAPAPAPEASMQTRTNPTIGHGTHRAAARVLTAIAADERYLDSSSFAVDPLASHGGSGENLMLRWNGLDSAIESIDIVVHLHGYSLADASAAMLRRKAAFSGLDLSLRSRPTLAVLPRGRHVTQAELARDSERARARAAATGARVQLPNPARYSFPGLEAGEGEGLEQLVGQSLQWWCTQVLGHGVAIDRVIFTAHSGGGAALNRLLGSRARRICNPHEVHVFDALYFGGAVMASGILGWARERIDADVLAGGTTVRADMASSGGGLRVFYGPSTRTNALWLAGELAGSDLVGARAAALAPWYRVEDGGGDHDGMPNAVGPRLLGSVAAEVVGPAAAGQAFGRGRSYGTPMGLFQRYATAPRVAPQHGLPSAPPLRRSARSVHGAFALVDQSSSQAEQSAEVRRNVARTIGQAEAGGRFDLVHDDSGRVNFGIGSWTGSRIAGVLDVYDVVAAELGATDRMVALFGGRAAFDALRQRFRDQGTAATASTAERAALRGLGQDVPLQEAQVRRLADDVQVDLDVIGSVGNPWYPFIDGGMGAISELAAHVLVHARHQAGSGGFPTVLSQAIASFGGEQTLGQAMVEGRVTEADFLTEVGERIVARVQANLQAGVRNRYRNLLATQAGTGLSYYFNPQ